jgi:FKBP-type peptidyl-prolyl cis-trans isomerase FkpA
MMGKRSWILPLAVFIAAGFYVMAVYTKHPPRQIDPAVMAALVKTDVKLGDGALATAGKTVAVHYTGWLYDEAAPNHHGKKFDSSRDRNAPFDFPLGEGRVIPGWDHGVEGMKVGGQRMLIVPPAMAYGSGGAGEVIPPNAQLVFDIELLAVQ